MVTISHIVKKIIEKKPFLEEAINRGIINYGALADKIQPEIEKEIGKKIKHSAVMMALRRYNKRANSKLIENIKFDKDTDIIMRSDIVEITITRSPDAGELVKRMYDIVDMRKDFISIIHGVHEISVMTNKRNEKQFMKLLKAKGIKSVNKGLSSITLNIPEESTETVGIFYMITRSLSWENIPIIEIISTWTEMTYLVRNDDAPRAFSIIKNIVEGNN